jgi:hypothetical protein
MAQATAMMTAVVEQQGQLLKLAAGQKQTK